MCWSTMAITEYDYGGGHHVFGGIAQADTLGIFGKQGLFDESSPQITQREGLAQIEGNRFSMSIPKLTVAHIVLSANADE